MTNQHPITPPIELVYEWSHMFASHSDEAIFTLVAQWGADQQLAAVATWLDHNILDTPHLRITPIGETLIAAMRPQPLSLKEQALARLEDIEYEIGTPNYDTIRKALEALPND